MSCGDPHETPCSDVLDHVYDYLDGEIDDEWQARVRQHLQECGPCLRQYHVERTVKTLIGRSCGCPHAPDQLRIEVVTRLQAIRLDYQIRGYRPD